MPELKIHITLYHFTKEDDLLTLPTGLQKPSQKAFINDETIKGVYVLCSVKDEAGWTN